MRKIRKKIRKTIIVYAGFGFCCAIFAGVGFLEDYQYYRYGLDTDAYVTKKEVTHFAGNHTLYTLSYHYTLPETGISQYDGEYASGMAFGLDQYAVGDVIRIRYLSYRPNRARIINSDITIPNYQSFLNIILLMGALFFGFLSIKTAYAETNRPLASGKQKRPTLSQ